MAKYKAARGKQRPQAPKPGAISCVVVILGGILLISFLFYLMLKAG